MENDAQHSPKRPTCNMRTQQTYGTLRNADCTADCCGTTARDHAWHTELCAHLDLPFEMPVEPAAGGSPG